MSKILKILVIFCLTLLFCLNFSNAIDLNLTDSNSNSSTSNTQNTSNINNEGNISNISASSETPLQL